MNHVDESIIIARIFLLGATLGFWRDNAFHEKIPIPGTNNLRDFSKVKISESQV